LGFSARTAFFLLLGEAVVGLTSKEVPDHDAQAAQADSFRDYDRFAGALTIHLWLNGS